MKKNIIENDKIRNSLINLLKLNRKSIQLLKPINIIKKDDDDKLNTSKNDSISNNSNNNKNIKNKSNLLLNESNEIKTIRVDSESENSITYRKNIKKSKIINLLSERTNNKVKKKFKIKFPLFLNKSKKKIHHRNNENLTSQLTSLNPSSNRAYIKNLDKYKNIFNSVSSRVKTNYNKNKQLLFNSNNFTLKNYSTKNVDLVNNFSPKKRKHSFGMSNKLYLTQSSARKQQSTIEDYNRTLNKEFNTQELINIENSIIEQRLKNFRIKAYDKSPLFKTIEKLNMYLGREFNLDITNLKKSFNKKYKVYTNSINKIKEIKHKNLFCNNNAFGYKINLDKNYNDSDNDDIYNFNSQLSDLKSKNALKTFYNNKAKDKLEKKLDLEKQLIELENKFSYIIEQEKAEKNRLGINYGEINQIIQKKFLYREIYELDRNQKKKQFFDEQAKILYKTRNYIQNKVVKEHLKQKTINKFKDIIGVHFS